MNWTEILFWPGGWTGDQGEQQSTLHVTSSRQISNTWLSTDTTFNWHNCQLTPDFQLTQLSNNTWLSTDTTFNWHNFQLTPDFQLTQVGPARWVTYYQKPKMGDYATSRNTHHLSIQILQSFRGLLIICPTDFAAQSRPSQYKLNSDYHKLLPKSRFWPR